MDGSGTSRGALVVGALLIVFGAIALVVRVSGVEVGWPAWVILPGVALLIAAFAVPEPGGSGLAAAGGIVTAVGTLLACLLYTSDAADDLLCVDLGGRRIIKKKKK